MSLKKHQRKEKKKMSKGIRDERLKQRNDYIRMSGITVMETEQEDEGKLIVEGVAVVFDQPTVLFEYDGVEYKEVIERGAFDNTDVSQCFFKYNHSNQVMAMARVKNGTLQLTIKDDGLHVRAELADTTGGRDLYTLIKRGDIDKMSFAFNIEEEEYDEVDHIFRVKKISTLWDVAAVNVPAYDGTSLHARRHGDVEALRVKEAEALAAERKKKENLQREIITKQIEHKLKRLKK